MFDALQAWQGLYPADEAALNRWLLSLLIAYVVLAYIVAALRGRKMSSEISILTIIFNGSTFAFSITLLWGFFDPAIMKLLGNTNYYLMFAGVAGVVYALHELIKRDP